ncbi:polysaccharide deacetylase family protein [Novosphingobium sp.]|uniref:polysaccharide deacetylase family protein n=1 Tax=Novosphingobium sp. TaxID=1874826 RepID=UPI0025D86E6A|nr:polysaccharide deacetylase family protein [Novosphingobium sp.]
MRITDPPAPGSAVQFAPDFGQRFILTVDTEEEFDWDKPIDRSGHTVHTIARLARFQEFCEGAGICPIYLVDYPIASSPAAAEILRPALAAGRAEIGVQLHPWVSPPHSEDVTEYNSFAGNLPADLEREKFTRLRETIAKAFGTAPLIYRAGRYGVGPNTAQMLADGGIAIDTSVRSNFDYSFAGGPNFRRLPLFPWWIDADRRLMELPLTTVYSGLLRQIGDWLYPRLWRTPPLRGVLSRLGVMERIPLTPEGVTLAEALRGIDIALDMGLPVLVFSFHSPSLAPGYTPYVRSEDDLDALYDWWRGVFTHLQRRRIAPASVGEIMTAVALA